MVEGSHLQKNHTWLAFVEDESTNEMLRSISQSSKIDFITNIGTIEQAIQYIQNDNSYTCLLIDISSCSNLDTQISKLSELCLEGTHLICIGQDNNIELFKKLRRMGVDDYLIKPLSIESVTDAIGLLSTDGTDETRELMPLLTIIGSRGGLGTTTLTINLSWILAHELKLNVCMIDLDYYYGDTMVNLNTDNNQGLIQALVNADRLDDVFIKRLTVEISPQLSILSAEQDLDHIIEYSREEILNLTNRIRKSYDICVVDVPHGHTFSDKSILYMASTIIILSELSLSSLRDTARLLANIKKYSPFAKVKIAVIRNPLAKASEVTRVQFEEGIGKEINYLIPYDKNIVLSAHNLGKVLAAVKPKHKVVNAFRDITLDLFPSKNAKSKSWWKPLLFWKM